MMKKHEHRKLNKKTLKLPKNFRNTNQILSDDSSDSDYDKIVLMKDSKGVTNS
jgi:hypothetical protein